MTLDRCSREKFEATVGLIFNSYWSLVAHISILGLLQGFATSLIHNCLLCGHQVSKSVQLPWKSSTAKCIGTLDFCVATLRFDQVHQSLTRTFLSNQHTYTFRWWLTHVYVTCPTPVRLATPHLRDHLIVAAATAPDHMVLR